MPIKAVQNISKTVFSAPIEAPIFINKYISTAGIKIIANKSEFICLYFSNLDH